MQHIIQKYKDGSVVQPATVTGLPAGGNAASAIANYMMGPMSSNATTLSYTAGGTGIPDYHALALEQKKLREAAALAAVQAQVVPSSSGQDKMEERNLPGGDLYKPNNDNNYGGTGVSFASGGGADGVGNFGAVGDFFGGITDSIGITNYKDSTDRLGNKKDEEGIAGSGGGGPRNMGGPIGYNMGSMKKPVGYNMGTLNGPIGYNVGGVSQVARTMLPEEQIQQRQMQQAQFSQGQGPLAEIGNALGMKVAGKGVDKALGKMAGSVAMKTAMGSIPVVGPFLAALFG
mgnify:CR=1 FL=1